MPPSKLNVGILGATGTVGQNFICLLNNHPLLKVAALGASPRSAGKAYSGAVKWKQSSPIPAEIAKIQVSTCDPVNFGQCQLIFSGLDAEVAGDIELAFRDADLPVFSNSKNHRRDPHVPLVVPHVNPDHLSIIPQQRSLQNPPLQRGFIVTNANCSVTVLTIPLAALEASFGPIDRVTVTTMQAISGAGYPGVPSLDIFDNIVPFISGEEDKMEWEASKILGGMHPESGFDLRAHAPLTLSASCNRVPVLVGHTECVSVRFARQPPPAPDQIEAAFRDYVSPAHKCESAPKRPIQLFDANQPDRPQPRLDRDLERGSGVCVGRVRVCPVLDIKFVVMGNNVSIGAAMSSIINAEYAIQEELVATT